MLNVFMSLPLLVKPNTEEYYQNLNYYIQVWKDITLNFTMGCLLEHLHRPLLGLYELSPIAMTIYFVTE